MDRETVRQWLKRQPFQPFRVHLKDGETFDIRYPRINLLSETFIKIGVPEAGSTDPLACDYTEFVWLNQIARLELLTEAVSA